MAETLRDLGVVVEHPAPNVYEIASGDVEWLFVPARGRGQDARRASSCSARSWPGSGGSSSATRAATGSAAGRSTCTSTRCGRSAPRSTTATATTSPRRPGRLRGAEVTFPFVSVMGTENAMLAATLADGHTVIRPAAQEPEVDDLIAFLQQMGASVERTAPDTIEIEGRKRLRGAEHRVVPDRIEAGTFVVAAAITGGRVTLEGAPCDHLGAFLDTLGRVGVGVSCGRDTIEVDGTGARRRRLPRLRHRDGPVPGPRHGPPAADLRAPDPGRGHVQGPRGDLRGPPRVAGRGPQDGRRGDPDRRRTTRRSTAGPACAAPRSRSATCAPAPR